MKTQMPVKQLFSFAIVFYEWTSSDIAWLMPLSALGQR